VPTTKPNLRQLAVLDWLRRWPGVYLREKGRWTAQWRDEAARMSMVAAVGVLGGDPSPGLDEQKGLGRFEGTPPCGSATFKALLAHGWVESSATEGRRPLYQVSAAGIAIAKRYGFSLKDYTPAAKRPAARPIRVSSRLVQRYGGPERAAHHAEFHERQAAQHLKVAARIRASLELWDGSEEQRRAEWMARGRRRQ